jgi:hypothetical protein
LKKQDIDPESIDFRGLRRPSIKEKGVVYIFGMVSRELGFVLEYLTNNFPDCEGKFLCDRERNTWVDVLIGFELKSSRFKTHRHDPSECDFIVCWIDDWPDCPVNVVELRSEIRKLPSKWH